MSYTALAGMRRISENRFGVSALPKNPSLSSLNWRGKKNA